MWPGSLASVTLALCHHHYRPQHSGHVLPKPVGLPRSDSSLWALRNPGLPLSDVGNRLCCGPALPVMPVNGVQLGKGAGVPTPGSTLGLEP